MIGNGHWERLGQKGISPVTFPAAPQVEYPVCIMVRHLSLCSRIREKTHFLSLASRHGVRMDASAEIAPRPDGCSHRRRNGVLTRRLHHPPREASHRAPSAVLSAAAAVAAVLSSHHVVRRHLDISLQWSQHAHLHRADDTAAVVGDGTCGVERDQRPADPLTSRRHTASTTVAPTSLH